MKWKFFLICFLLSTTLLIQPRTVKASESRTVEIFPTYDSFGSVLNTKSNYGKETYLNTNNQGHKTILEARSFTAPAWGSEFLSVYLIAHCKIVGSFDVTEGMNRDINFVITNSDPTRPPFSEVTYFYQKNSVTHLDFSFTAPYTGNFYLGFDNSFSYFTEKKISISNVVMSMEPFQIICSPIFLQFDVSSIPPKATINSAKLEMIFKSSKETSSSVVKTYYCAQNNWNEQTITFENAPMSQLFGTSTSSLDTSGFLNGALCEWDIKPDVIRSLPNGKLTEVLALVSSDSQTGLIDFYSKESENKPKLVITYTYVSIDLLATPSIVRQGESVLLDYMTNPVQTEGTSIFQHSKDQVQWTEFTSFPNGSRKLNWTPNLSGLIYVRAIWVNSWQRGSYTAEKITSFTIDGVAPSVTITYPIKGDVVRSSSPEITWNGSDDLAGIDHYEVVLDQGPWENVESNTYFKSKDLSDGTHVFTVKAFDKVGLSKEDTISFIVNTSLIGEPGWMDDAQVFGLGIFMVAAIMFYFWIVRKRSVSN